MSTESMPLEQLTLSPDTALARDLYAAAHKFDEAGAIEFIRLYLRLYRQQIQQDQLEQQLRQRRRRAGKAAP